MFQTVTGYAHHVVVKPVDYLLPRILASMLKIIYLSAASSVNVNVRNSSSCSYEGSTKYLNNMFFYVVHTDHPSCLQDLLNTFLAEKWFCSKDCEEVRQSRPHFQLVFVNSHQEIN